MLRYADMKKLFSITLLLLVLTVSGTGEARVKTYTYDGDLPMITFMLNMMVAMGILDKLPDGYANTWQRGGYPTPYNYLRSNPWSGSSLWGGLPKQWQNRSCFQPPCDTGYVSLQGIWISSTGEMLGIKEDKIVWSDGHSRYAKGVLRQTPQYLFAKFTGSRKMMPIEYQLVGNQLNLRDEGGELKRFYRLIDSKSWQTL